MKKYWKKISAFFVIVALILILLPVAWELFTFEAVKKNSAELETYVEAHYLLSLFTFAAAFIVTAFFIPGALILTVSGGFLFGPMAGAVYAALFSTIGSSLAFLMSRYLIGAWVQKRYRKQLNRFNEEMSRHGHNYLFVLRVIPVLPSFLINYLSGLTRISLIRFAVVTFLGICPGAVIYSMAGRQLASIEHPKDILSVKVIGGLSLLAVFALLPVIHDRIRRPRRRKKAKHD
jgi:uncharacterized membrane protein YdjX (TVP38/TMEM64 family)